MENYASTSSSSAYHVPKKRRTTTTASGTTTKKKPQHYETPKPCSECGKRFWSKKALYGHMRCHPERQWRGMKPPKNTNLLRLCSAVQHNHIVQDYSLSVLFTEEEREVASCLLMLADSEPLQQVLNNNNITAAGEIVTAASTSDHSTPQQLTTNYCGRFECSNCKKVFSSHQALGGHRASHKNVKGCYANNKIMSDGDCRGVVETMNGEDKEVNNVVHKCWICLRVFASGQALGGHMRCHWEKAESSSSVLQQSSQLSSRTLGFEFDLNCPARVDDRGNSDHYSCNPYRDLVLRLGF